MSQAFRAAVLTVSDAASHGRREDESGRAVADTLAAAGFVVAEPTVVPDDRPQIERALRELAAGADLLVTTGGTGLGPRDVTPEATRAVIDREAQGFAEAMRATGRLRTPMADLSRGVAGTVGTTLVLNLPGRPQAATESLEAVLPLLPHALSLLGGRTEHRLVDPAPLRAVEEAIPSNQEPAAGRDEPVVVATAVRTRGEPPCRPGQKLVVGARGLLAGTLGCAEFDAAALADARPLLTSGATALKTYAHDAGEIDVYLEARRPAPRLIVLGATPVALWLLRWGRDLGYQTVLVEPRRDRVTAEHRVAAHKVVELVEDVSVGEDTDAVHTDHDAPRVVQDLAALVGEGVRFAGLMGSATHAGPHLEALRAAGLTREQVATVQTPVGLDIGAHSSQEIALSILAGLVAARSGRGGGWLHERAPRGGVA